jgi:hypothetical protein
MIANAAIRFNNQTHIGRTHIQILDRMIKKRIFDGGKTVDGFVNEKGLFLTRHQAADHAFECGQIPAKKPELFSYDLGWKKMIEYKIMQTVKSVNKNWQHEIYTGKIERLAFHEFDRLTKEFPSEYFELIQIEHNETCLKFTKRYSKPFKTVNK